MKIMITGFDVDGYITAFRDISTEVVTTTVGEETITVPIEANNISIFEIEDIETPDFYQNHMFYKVYRKKLKLDLEKKISEDDASKRKSIITLKSELLKYKKQRMDFEVYDISTEEVDKEIENLEKQIKDLM